MDLNEYQRLASATAETYTGNDAKLVAALGCAGEGGEFAEVVKKEIFHHHPVDREKALKELGDQLWYIAYGADAYGYTLEEVAVSNIEKLRVRYPETIFTTEDSIARRDTERR
jgi:NTP pyrophosphatase (non-canonical NTP hydrolase)